MRLDTRVDLHWLGLLDQLYALVETPGAEAALAGTVDEWPAPWRPLIARWAARIGARSIQIASPFGARIAPQSPGHEPGLLSHRRITGQVISAHSASPEGFTDAQAREFKAFCSHLHSAWALRSTLDAAQASLAALHDVIDALPMGLVVLDERAEVVMTNRQGDKWLARLREIDTPPPLLAQLLQSQYGLTDKELPLAWNLAQGMPLKQYAALSGRSIETPRAQLKAVFRKLGVSDQKGVSFVLFEALHAVTLQAMGAGVAAWVAERQLPTPESAPRLSWR
ncbi:hypothetical protein [Piscinibacter gummiphilus]|uniref:HTH luxR-type domain-containing protein n=1 Tax=Piscinibacter gummiphilus TaxID=946333 RepID=A0ABZ0CUI0_9BURK|nr:hypothetical protein [Piscinibacter gummiphilus]WOB08619.1 hypothetical protein RXV79_00870 [Piscinibacter gummiphilus]